MHGYAGFIGLIICGFVLWGAPSSPMPDYASINPLGQFIGAIIMFFVLGFAPAWVVAKILDGMSLLRVPKEVELLGLDFSSDEAYENALADVKAAEKALLNG